jgi:neuronal calcium sensor 1
MFNQRRSKAKYSLNEHDVQFIMANTDFTREKILIWFNEFQKQCPSGQLDREQFTKFYKQLIPGETQAEIEFSSIVFDVFDSDKNGYVDFGEFLIAFWVRARGDIREKLSWLFDIYDTDGSGHITQYELYKMLRLVFDMKGVKEDPWIKAKEIIDKIDRSKDGKLSRQEFIAGLTANPELRSLFSPY